MAEYAVCAGGAAYNAAGKEMDVFTTVSTGIENVANNITLSTPRVDYSIVGCNGYLVVMGGRSIDDDAPLKSIEIFKNNAGTFEPVSDHGLELSVARSNISAIAVGSFVFAAGGHGVSDEIHSTATLHDTIDVFKITIDGTFTAVNHNVSLSSAREYIAAANIGNRVFFMGGQYFTGEETPQIASTNSVDVLLLEPGNNTVVAEHPSPALQLSSETHSLRAIGCGKYILAAGGSTASNVIDVFELNGTNISKNTDFKLQLSSSRADVAVAKCGQYVFFMGGANVSAMSNAIDVFKVANDSIEPVSDHGLTLSEARYDIATATLDNKYVLAIGGKIPGNNTYISSNTIDVFQIGN